MYFADGKGTAFMSSYNCKDVELTDAIPDDIEPALNVPGKAITDVEKVEWTGDSTITADFDGISENDVLLVKWRSCCEAT